MNNTKAKIMKTDYFLTKDFKNWYIEQAYEREIDVINGGYGPAEIMTEIETNYNLHSQFSLGLKEERHEIDGYCESTTYELINLFVSEFEVFDEEGELLNLDYSAIINFLQITEKPKKNTILL